MSVLAAACIPALSAVCISISMRGASTLTLCVVITNEQTVFACLRFDLFPEKVEMKLSFIRE